MIENYVGQDYEVSLAFGIPVYLFHGGFYQTLSTGYYKNNSNLIKMHFFITLSF